MRGGAVLTVFMAASLAGAGADAQGLVEWQDLVLPGACTLRIAVPQGWNARMERTAACLGEIEITPESGPRAVVTMTQIAVTPGLPMRSTGEVKAAVRRMGEAALATSVEKDLVLERVDGTDGAGFFYSLTDRRETPAFGARHLTQGIMEVGPLRLAVTVLANEPASAARAAALDLLRTAGCASARASRQ